MAKKDEFDFEAEVEKQVAEYCTDLSARIFEHLGNEGGAALATASPIEAMFGVALYLKMLEMRDIGPDINDVGMGKSGCNIDSLVFPPWTGMWVYPQVHIDRFRVDFALLVRDFEYGSAKFVIECDGHDFHERTKAQATRDKARDRAIQARGIPVLRYTGSEIWRDAASSADNALEIAISNMRQSHLRDEG